MFVYALNVESSSPSCSMNRCKCNG